MATIDRTTPVLSPDLHQETDRRPQEHHTSCQSTSEPRDLPRLIRSESTLRQVWRSSVRALRCILETLEGRRKMYKVPRRRRPASLWLLHPWHHGTSPFRLLLAHQRGPNPPTSSKKPQIRSRGLRQGREPYRNPPFPRLFSCRQRARLCINRTTPTSTFRLDLPVDSHRGAQKGAIEDTRSRHSLSKRSNRIMWHGQRLGPQQLVI